MSDRKEVATQSILLAAQLAKRWLNVSKDQKSFVDFLDTCAEAGVDGKELLAGAVMLLLVVLIKIEEKGGISPDESLDVLIDAYSKA